MYVSENRVTEFDLGDYEEIINTGYERQMYYTKEKIPIS